MQAKSYKELKRGRQAQIDKGGLRGPRLVITIKGENYHKEAKQAEKVQIDDGSRGLRWPGLL